jgi:exonuclease III
MIMDDNVTVLSMNVRGLFSNSKKRADVFDWAKSKHASIVCFQETQTTFQSPHNKILVFEKVNTFCNIILNSEGSSVL